MSYSTLPNPSDLVLGERFTVERSRSASSPETVRKVVTLSGEDGWLRDAVKKGPVPAYDADGAEFLVAKRDGFYRIDGDGASWSAHCTWPLPGVPDAETIAYAQAIVSKPAFAKTVHDRPAFFHIRGFEGRHALAVLVSSAESEREDQLVEAERIEGSREISGTVALGTYAIRLPLSSLPEAIGVGDLVKARYVTCRHVQGFVETKPFDAATAACGVSAKDLGRWFPARRLPAIGDRLIVAPRSQAETFTIAEHLNELARADAKLEPDEALVLCLDDGSGVSSAVSVLGKRGAAFFDPSMDPHDDLSAREHPEGLWIFADAAWWSSCHDGEWDGGLEGDFVPATVADLARFGYAPADLEADILDALDGRDLGTVEAGSLAEHFMDAARKSEAPAPGT